MENEKVAQAPPLTPDQEEYLKRMEKAVSEGKSLESFLSPYNTPGMKIQGKDGSEYVVSRTGSWIKTQSKTNFNRQQRELRRQARKQVVKQVV
jgi:hypothetical protein